MRFLIATVAALFVGTASAQAACTLEDLAGSWTTAESDEAEICKLTFKDDGNITGTCTTYTKSGKVDETRSAKGKVRIDEDTCAVEGNITRGGKTRSFQGNTAADLSIIIGTVRRQNGFIGYKDLD
jgi:hypothetical protein